MLQHCKVFYHFNGVFIAVRCAGGSRESLGAGLRRPHRRPDDSGGFSEKTLAQAHGHLDLFVAPVSPVNGHTRAPITRFATDSSCGTRFASIHRVFSSIRKQIKSGRASVDAWSPPQAVCHQTWSPLQAGCHHHDTARFNTVQQIPTNRPYLALWGVINNPEPKPILGTPPTTWPSYALRCLPNPWAWGSG